MSLEFSGPATKMTAKDIALAAASLDCDTAAVMAVIDVESGGGFLPDTRPKILFERHIFHGLTGGRFDGGHPGISSASPGGYSGGAAEYGRLAQAIALNRSAGLQAASWGAFQILGENFDTAGFAGIEAFVAAMCLSEGAHLVAFINFVQKSGLADELRRRDWMAFARGYNGPGYRKNRYDQKLAAAYLLRSTGPRAEGGAPRTLRMGDTGRDVAALQVKLGVAADGDFGLLTKAAVVAFQHTSGLAADGIVGAATRAKLGL